MSASNTTASKGRSKKNAPGNRIDFRWKYGENVQGNGKKVICNYCLKILSGGIFIFKFHIGGTRDDYEPCAMVLEEIKFLMKKIVVEAKEA